MVLGVDQYVPTAYYVVVSMLSPLCIITIITTTLSSVCHFHPCFTDEDTVSLERLDDFLCAPPLVSGRLL